MVAVAWERVAESEARGHCVNVVTLDLTVHCYNFARFFAYPVCV
jgi:hypothetical protein